jgi:hypothetical protein
LEKVDVLMVAPFNVFICTDGTLEFNRLWPCINENENRARINRDFFMKRLISMVQMYENIYERNMKKVLLNL